MVKVVFMGTPDFAVPALEALIAAHEVIGVVTQPDRPAGRRSQIQPPPVKKTAEAHNIPVFQPEKIRTADAIETLQQWSPDVFVVAAFGQILPQKVLDIPPHGSLNIHASLLPRWRGAAPIHAAIRAGDTETGITIMKMDAGLDTGPMLTQRSTSITTQDTSQSLHDTLARIGAELLLDTLPAYLAGEITPQAQDDTLSTYAPAINKAEGRIDWAQDAASIERLVRAFTPWPGTFTFWNGQQLKILAGETGAGDHQAGEVFLHGDRLAIGTGDGLFYPTRLQLAGRSAVSVGEFLRGRTDIINAQLGQAQS